VSAAEALPRIGMPEDPLNWMDSAGLDLRWEHRVYDEEFKLSEFVTVKRPKDDEMARRRSRLFEPLEKLCTSLTDDLWGAIPPKDRLTTVIQFTAATLVDDRDFEKHVRRKNSTKQSEADFKVQVTTAGAIRLLMTYRQARREGHWP
jgi:hypothetical protein